MRLQKDAPLKSLAPRGEFGKDALRSFWHKQCLECLEVFNFLMVFEFAQVY